MGIGRGQRGAAHPDQCVAVPGRHHQNRRPAIARLQVNCKNGRFGLPQHINCDGSGNVEPLEIVLIRLKLGVGKLHIQAKGVCNRQRVLDGAFDIVCAIYVGQNQVKLRLETGYELTGDPIEMPLHKGDRHDKQDYGNWEEQDEVNPTGDSGGHERLDKTLLPLILAKVPHP
ncbi:MAG: hypothetical protein OXB95_01340 [Rhodobacteraceae bacterium]|nr:hypothetical protein [Paracoccaceae bacterium]